jgi:hypothetical protein
VVRRSWTVVSVDAGTLPWNRLVAKVPTTWTDPYVPCETTDMLRMSLRNRQSAFWVASDHDRATTTIFLRSVLAQNTVVHTQNAVPERQHRICKRRYQLATITIGDTTFQRVQNVRSVPTRQQRHALVASFRAVCDKELEDQPRTTLLVCLQQSASEHAPGADVRRGDGSDPKGFLHVSFFLSWYRYARKGSHLKMYSVVSTNAFGDAAKKAYVCMDAERNTYGPDGGRLPCGESFEVVELKTNEFGNWHEQLKKRFIDVLSTNPDEVWNQLNHFVVEECPGKTSKKDVKTWRSRVTLCLNFVNRFEFPRSVIREEDINIRRNFMLFYMIQNAYITKESRELKPFERTLSELFSKDTDNLFDSNTIDGRDNEEVFNILLADAAHRRTNYDTGYRITEDILATKHRELCTWFRSMFQTVTDAEIGDSMLTLWNWCKHKLVNIVELLGDPTFRAADGIMLISLILTDPVTAVKSSLIQLVRWGITLILHLVPTGIHALAYVLNAPFGIVAHIVHIPVLNVYWLAALFGSISIIVWRKTTRGKLMWADMLRLKRSVLSLF